MQAILAPVKPEDLLVIGADVYHGETQDDTKYFSLFSYSFFLFFKKNSFLCINVG